MHAFAHHLLLALAIGAEVFAIAALWPLSEWAATAPRRGGLALALFVIVACAALDAHGLAFAAMARGSLPWRIAHALEWTPPLLLLALPDAVCVASAQSLARTGMPVRYARAVALALAAVTVVLAPIATLTAGCGLTGTCS